MDRGLRELREELPEDRISFHEQERLDLARRWRVFAPIALAIAVVGEVLPYFTPEFPPNLAVSASQFLVLLAVYVLAVRNASRRALQLATAVAGIWSGVYAGFTVADSGGFESIHLLGMVLVIAVLPGVFALPLPYSIAAIGGSVATFIPTTAFKLHAEGKPLDGLETALFYVSFLAAITLATVERNRRLRYGEFVAHRVAGRLHRFAVEEVLCRHLPARYVERVLSGEHPLNAPPERRVVTVLFADMVSFTPLSESLPPERLAAVMARFYDVTAQAAFERGATIDKFIGDAVMAILGAPEPMDPSEQARRAVEVAQAWHQAVAALASAADQIPPIHLRIGIHQDVVAVGSFGGRHRSDYTVLGRGVNVAARLEQRCSPGEILLSEDVMCRLDPAPLDARALGPVELKGIPEKVACYALPTRPARHAGAA